MLRCKLIRSSAQAGGQAQRLAGQCADDKRKLAFFGRPRSFRSTTCHRLPAYDGSHHRRTDAPTLGWGIEDNLTPVLADIFLVRVSSKRVMVGPVV